MTIINTRLIRLAILSFFGKHVATSSSDVFVGQSWQVCTLLVGEVAYKSGGSELFAACQLSEGSTVHIKGLTQSWLKARIDAGDIISGTTQTKLDNQRINFQKSHAWVDDETQLVLSNNRTIADPQDNADEHQRRQLAVLGQRKVLVVRVIAKWQQSGQTHSIETTASEAELSDKVFGTHGDSVNLRKQIRRCSNYKLDFVPATGNGVHGGVVTVTINRYPYAGSEWLLISEINKVLNQMLAPHQYGAFDHWGPPLKLDIDHVMYCLPKNTVKQAVAWALLNHWMTVYSDEWSTYPSAQLHEIGHNLGLMHSGEEGREAADTTGVMGYGYARDEGPRMCFNGAKTWQLGWFRNRHAWWNRSPDYAVTLFGAVDYHVAKPWHKILLRVKTGADKIFYVSFNRAVRHNIGTREGRDKVMVVRENNVQSVSWLQAKLGSGDSYIFPSDLPACPKPQLSVTLSHFAMHPPRAWVRIDCV